jgi:hypothetical protein
MHGRERGVAASTVIGNGIDGGGGVGGKRKKIWMWKLRERTKYRLIERREDDGWI